MDRSTDQEIDRKNGKEGKKWHSFQGNVFSEKEGSRRSGRGTLEIPMILRG